MADRQVNQLFFTYNTSDKVLIPHNAILLINTGASNVVINNSLVLAPGASYGYGLNENEVCTSTVDINFPSGSGACLVILTVYA